MKNILFVCTGNTCRSPMAEAFLRESIDADPSLSARFSSGSAGVSACGCDRASPEAISVMGSEWGIDLSGHRASPLTGEAVRNAYLILTMTEGHKHHLVSFYPGAADKTFTLLEYACEDETGPAPARRHCPPDIPDPFGGSPGHYSQCAYEIRQAVLKLVEKLKKSR